MHSAQIPPATCQNGTRSKSSVNEDEVPAELDEPPEHLIYFTRVAPFNRSTMSKKQSMMSSSLAHCRKKSLLTQALSVSPELTPNSDAEAPMLTSDGGLTSPARTNSASPPLPATHPNGLATITPHECVASDGEVQHKHIHLPLTANVTDSAPATDLEVGLGRKRCIKFACGRQAAAPPESSQPAKVEDPKDQAAKTPTKRPCMLKFVCPMKPPTTPAASRPPSKDALSNNQTEGLSSTVIRYASTISSENLQHRDSVSTAQNAPIRGGLMSPGSNHTHTPPVFNRIDLEGSEATRFHEFAGPYDGEDEWVHEQTAHRRKVTVNDTLQKENAIRKLGEEAEEEALDEENAAEEDEAYDELDDLNHGLPSDDGISDAGNETDDEEGFAESEDGSAMGSDYQFWTTGLTTAATSADHFEHMRLNASRMTSTSSMESMINVKDDGTATAAKSSRVRKASRTQPVKMRPGTPDLPDSTDFVCGTLDEDRPLEAAYMSCLEERRRSRHRIIPQDIDPSFPTSDPELDKEDDGNMASKHASDEPLWVTGKPDNSDEEQVPPQRKSLGRRNTKSPMPSPKRIRSPPPPQKRSIVHRSPPPLIVARRSSDSSRSASSCEDEDNAQSVEKKSSSFARPSTKPQKMVACQLPRRPQLTQTASLPRTPNPFWAPTRQWSHQSSAAASPKSKAPDMRSRGPIDIVTGLEKKRQRRKEKFWRQHCRNGAKDKERRCQPGEGAERMRELGLEIAGKNKGYMPQAQLMLSI